MILGNLLSAVLLITGGLTIAYGVHFFRLEKNAGHFRSTMLILGLSAGVWQIGYGLFGMLDDYAWCTMVRRIALLGVVCYPLAETILGLRMAGVNQKLQHILRVVLTIFAVTDWILFSRPEVDVFLTVGNWTTFRAVDCPERNFHGVYVVVLFIMALLAWLLWYRKVTLRRDKALMYGIFVANMAIMVGAVPDTIMVRVLSYGYPTSGLGAGLSFALWYVAAENYNTFSVSSRTLMNYAKRVLKEGIIILNQKLEIVELNEFAGTELGLSSGMHLQEILLPEEDPEELVQQLLKQNKIRFKARLSGRQEVYMASMTAALDRYQDPYGYVIAMTDITKEEALILEAESGSRAKSNFLANMSHEIRTPMNVIRGMAEVILRDSSDEEARKNAGMIVTASESLLSIINDILDFSKIESGKLEILEEPFHLLSLINDVVTMIGIRLKDTQVELITRVDPEIPSGLLGDELRIKQVLINLLNNAVKFTRQGSVTLKVSCEITDQTQCLLRMDVIDTGIGIREEDLQQIFESFTQVDARINREVEGTGLGLAISRNLVRAMGGEIGAKSQYGEGSDFYLTIPCKITDPKPCGDLREDRNLRVQEAFKPAFKAEGARVLVVDDNDMNLQVAEGLLKPYGILPTKVQSGIAAVRCVEKMELFDLIFMDHMMPGMDGMEAMQKIREMQPEQHVPIIALTANAISGMEQQYRQAGFDGFLAKPIEPEKLDGLLRKYLKQ